MLQRVATRNDVAEGRERMVLIGRLEGSLEVWLRRLHTSAVMPLICGEG